MQVNTMSTQISALENLNTSNEYEISRFKVDNEKLKIDNEKLKMMVEI